jgi:hypothetical protein
MLIEELLIRPKSWYQMGGLLGLGSFVPSLPVSGLTFPFVDQLSVLELFALVRSCGGTYVPSFLV